MNTNCARTAIAANTRCCVRVSAREVPASAQAASTRAAGHRNHCDLPKSLSQLLISTRMCGSRLELMVAAPSAKNIEKIAAPIVSSEIAIHCSRADQPCGDGGSVRGLRRSHATDVRMLSARLCAKSLPGPCNPADGLDLLQSPSRSVPGTENGDRQIAPAADIDAFDARQRRIAKPDRVRALGKAARMARLDQREAARALEQEVRRADAVGQERFGSDQKDEARLVIAGGRDQRVIAAGILARRARSPGSETDWAGTERCAHRPRSKEGSPLSRPASSSARGRRRRKATRRGNRK